MAESKVDGPKGDKSAQDERIETLLKTEPLATIVRFKKSREVVLPDDDGEEPVKDGEVIGKLSDDEQAMYSAANWFARQNNDEIRQAQAQGQEPDAAVCLLAEERYGAAMHLMFVAILERLGPAVNGADCVIENDHDIIKLPRREELKDRIEVMVIGPQQET